jgi:hypothetical protein
MKKIKTYMTISEFNAFRLRDIQFDKEEPVTITEGHVEPLDQSALGFFLGFIVGTLLGMAALFYASTIPLGQ